MKCGTNKNMLFQLVAILYPQSPLYRVFPKVSPWQDKIKQRPKSTDCAQSLLISTCALVQCNPFGSFSGSSFSAFVPNDTVIYDDPHFIYNTVLTLPVDKHIYILSCSLGSLWPTLGSIGVALGVPTPAHTVMLALCTAAPQQATAWKTEKLEGLENVKMFP